MRPEIAAALEDPRHDLVGGAGTLLGPWQLEALRSIGTLPPHRTLDVGCGTLRGGLCIAEYLDPGCYFGVEPSPELLSIARELARSTGLTERGVSLADLGGIDHARFDRVLTQNVLDHLDRQGIEGTVARVASVLATHGWWLGMMQVDETADPVALGAQHPRRAREYVASLVNERWFASLLCEHGLWFGRAPELTHPRGLTVFVARRTLAEKAVALLERLVSLDTSPEGDGVRAMIDLLCAHLSRLGFDIEVVPGSGAAPLLVARRSATGGGRGKIVLYNHYDAVGCHDGGLIESDGRLFGPGVGDNKGPLATRLVALEVAPRTPEIVWLIQGEEESGAKVARAVFPSVLAEVHADLVIDEAGWHDADGTQRVLACTIAPDGGVAPPDERSRQFLELFRGASRTSIRTEARTLDKRFVPGGCAFRSALPAGSRYLSLGPLDGQTRIHSPGESIPLHLLEPAMTQLIDLLRWSST